MGLGSHLGLGGDVGLSLRSGRHGASPNETRRRFPSLLANTVIGAVIVAGVALAAAVAPGALDAAREHPAALASFAGLAAALQLVAGLYRRGSISLAGVGMLAAGFALGVRAAVATALACAAVHFARRRGKLHRALFSAAALALAAGGATALYHLVETDETGSLARVVLALGAGAVSWAVNTALVATAISASDDRAPFAVWRCCFGWMATPYLAFGPLALAAVLAFEALGPAGLLAFAAAPAALGLSVRRDVTRRRPTLDARGA